MKTRASSALHLHTSYHTLHSHVSNYISVSVINFSFHLCCRLSDTHFHPRFMTSFIHLSCAVFVALDGRPRLFMLTFFHYLYSLQLNCDTCLHLVHSVLFPLTFIPLLPRGYLHLCKVSSTGSLFSLQITM